MELDQSFGLVFSRALGLVTFLPLDYLTPGVGLKILLTLVLSVISYSIAIQREDVGLTDYSLEFLAGVTQALPLLLILQAIEITAELIESLRGQNLGSILNPLNQSENMILPVLLRSILWLVLLQSGVLEQVFVGFQSGLNHIASDPEFWRTNLASAILIVAAGFKLPILFAFVVLAVEIGFIFLYRLIPNIETESARFLVRSYVCGLILLILLKTNLITRFTDLYWRVLHGRL